MSDHLALSCSSAHVQEAVDVCINGDRVLVPEGTAAYSVAVTVPVCISILAAGIGLTTIIDERPIRGGGIGDCKLFVLSMPSPTVLMRLSGFTFSGSSDPTYQVQDQGGTATVTVSGVSSVLNFRLDNCHFTNLYARNVIFYGAVFGSVDNNQFDTDHFSGCMSIGHASFKGVGAWGDNSWAQPTNWGSNEVLFIEDNTFQNFDSATCIDSQDGARIVVRYNTGLHNNMGNHGTETGGRSRGCRSMEIYNNNFQAGLLGTDPQDAGWAIYVRSGAALVWGNILGDDAGTHCYDRAVVLALYRTQFPARPWLQADGANVWDVNDTADHTGNGFGGGPGGVFATGTHTGANGSATLTDAAATWTVGQWQSQGYTVRNLTKETASTVEANTGTVITVTGNSVAASMVFDTGDDYEIRRILIVLDQPGRGQGDYISGGNDLPFPDSVPPTPTTWPNDALEPVRVWSNTIKGNGNGKGYSQVGAQTGGVFLLENVDYYYSTNDSAKPVGYVPAIYPNPLNSGEVPVEPTRVTDPVISGTAEVGRTLTVTPGDYDGSQVIVTNHQWEREVEDEIVIGSTVLSGSGNTTLSGIGGTSIASS